MVRRNLGFALGEVKAIKVTYSYTYRKIFY